MRRREFITLLGGAAAWPSAARAQQSIRMRRVGALIGGSENYPASRRYSSAFKEELAKLGWVDGVICGSSSVLLSAATLTAPGPPRRNW
jgi:putative ABC transport system substrate-binding protein